MKLTKVEKKIRYSVGTIPSKCFEKINTSFDIRRKIHNEIRRPNEDLIERLQMRILNNLKNEIN